MDAETKELQRENLRLSTEQQAEIGDILLSARAVSRQMIAQAQTQAEEILKDAQERADAIVKAAEEQAGEMLQSAGEQAAETLRLAEERARELAPAEEKTDTPPALSEEMQDYVVRFVGDCFGRLRQQQLETADFLSEQWRAFLSGLSLPELPTPGAARKEASDSGISRQDIENRVSAIARELMEIIGKET